jgi:hypothetical protein
MSLMARLRGMWRRHDERLLEEGLEARASGVEGDDLSLTPGLDREIESGFLRPGVKFDQGTSPGEAAEDEKPE